MNLFEIVKSKIRFAVAEKRVIALQRNRIKLLECSLDVQKKLNGKYADLFENDLNVVKMLNELEQSKNKLIEHNAISTIEELKLLVLALEGELGHPIPSDKKLPKCNENILAKHLNSSLNSAQKRLQKSEISAKQHAFENSQCKTFIYDLERFLMIDHPAKQIVRDFMSSVNWKIEE